MTIDIVVVHLGLRETILVGSVNQPETEREKLFLSSPNPAYLTKRPLSLRSMLIPP